MQLREQADEVRELFRTLIQLHARRGAVKVGFGPLHTCLRLGVCLRPDVDYT